MLTRYRMDVVSATVSEAISQAGGPLCDRSPTGWDISVFATDDTAEHDLALRILAAVRAGGMPLEPADRPLRTGRLHQAPRRQTILTTVNGV